uniref:Uncharacterized protein n=1 Tax=Panagrolaimus davidi TaxID=227884 RepID=A0A914R3R8_9BILA
MEQNSVLKRLLKPQPQIISSPTNNNNTVNLISKLSIQSLSKADSPTKSNILGHTKKSAFHPTTVSVPLRKSTGTEISITNGRRTEVAEEEVTDPQIPPVPPGLFTPEQMEFIMK